MPDHMDHVQAAVQAATDAAVAQATQPKRGTTHCEECGEPIGEYRQALGARLCLVHQREAEQRALHNRRGAR
jgi:RNA polymerase-binding transcription factor DksA